MANERNAVGRYSKLIFVALLSAIVGGVGAYAEIVPTRGKVDGRVRTAQYDGDQVYRLRGFVGYQIDIEFEAGETFVGIGAGDIEALSFFGQDNHLFLKPKAARIATNFTVLTNRRHYQFAYTAIPQHRKSADAEVIFALRFTYPATLEQEAARKIDADLGLASARRPQNSDYWYCGPASLKPAAASDDGVHTRFRFAANADLPAIFVRNEDDSESLLNYSMEDGDVIVHRVARRFALRRGKLVGCLVNRGFSGGGERLDSGTVTPEVERGLQGGVP